MSKEQKRCTRCGLNLNAVFEYCPACGFKLGLSEDSPKRARENTATSRSSDSQPHSRKSRQVPDPLKTHPVNRKPNKRTTAPRPYKTSATNQASFSNPFGWQTLNGVVITADAPYMAKPDSNPLVVLFKLVIGLSLFPLILFTFLCVLAGKTAWSIQMAMLFPNRNSGNSGGGFLSGLMSQFAGYFLVGKLFGQKDMVSVRDIRLRTSSGNEHLVRIQGDLVTGNINVGDQIEIEGVNRKGTLFFRRGINKRTNSEITVRRG